jgi:hypothetical protein
MLHWSLMISAQVTRPTNYMYARQVPCEPHWGQVEPQESCPRHATSDSQLDAHDQNDVPAKSQDAHALHLFESNVGS